MRHVLKRLQVSLPNESGFNAADNPYSSKEFFKLCEDYGVPHDNARYQNKGYYQTYQQGMKWLDDYLCPDSMCWINEMSQGFTNVGLYRISDNVRAYTYLILSLQTSLRSHIIGNTASALTHVVNRTVDIKKDIKGYQDPLSYASSKVDCSVGLSM